ncbi:PREDICTED: uncharacterized protein LOC105364827 [Ceratosolen solmsi marchali]|uniref:Uncharacterized protein LOC105364827 n=1 Tax=Ceratosolen solmsi marchali TaxID=326594 RepID=A0AAJ6YN90_9HYME|nr:PREDICTED: uncharacterized protein LOC105364827 [Ceratosolen solmsi marchali]
MEHFDIFKIPENPKLKFGEPLSDVCDNGIFHSGLKDLYLKAYLSAKGDDVAESCNEGTNVNKISRILLALKSGSDGQGTLHQRISLMAKLEAGRWLMPVQTPAGAPLWLLRHFLGRLPQPLLQGSHWKTIGETCGASAFSRTEEVIERISVSVKALSRTEFEVLALLTLLINRLSLIDQPRDKEEFSNDVLCALSEYFIASIITRPYRPGLNTKLDKKCQPLLIFMSKNWNAIFEKTSRTAFFDHLSTNKRLQKSLSTELHSYFQSNNCNTKHTDNQSSNKFIGFEPLLIEDNINRSKKNPDNDIRSKSSLQRNIFDNLLLSESSSEENFSEIDILEHFESDAESAKNFFPHHSTLTKDNNIKAHMVKDEDLLLKETASTSALLPSKKTDFGTKSNLKLRKRALFCNRFPQNLLISRLDKVQNIVNTSSTEYEFYSIPNSENSD